MTSSFIRIETCCSICCFIDGSIGLESLVISASSPGCMLSSSSDPHGLWPGFKRTVGSSRPSLTLLSLLAGTEGPTCKLIPFHRLHETFANFHHR